MSYKLRNNPIRHPLLLSKCFRISGTLEFSNVLRILTATGGGDEVRTKESIKSRLGTRVKHLSLASYPRMVALCSDHHGCRRWLKVTCACSNLFRDMVRDLCLMDDRKVLERTMRVSHNLSMRFAPKDTNGQSDYAKNLSQAQRTSCKHAGWLVLPELWFHHTKSDKGRHDATHNIVLVL